MKCRSECGEGLAVQPPITPARKRIVGASQGWRCGKCDQLLPASFQVDHIVKRSLGGSNDASNLMALCNMCHGMKVSRQPAWARRLLTRNRADVR